MSRLCSNVANVPVKAGIRWSVQTARARFQGMALGVIVLIVYGSLYPFGFHPCAFSFPALLHTSATPSSRGDLLSNILLYVPLGFFAARSVRSWHRAIPAASALGVALSFLVEMTQECVLSRVPSMADVIANGAGALIGSLLAVALRSNYSALLIACWIGSRLFPYPHPPRAVIVG